MKSFPNFPNFLPLKMDGKHESLHGEDHSDTANTGAHSSFEKKQSYSQAVSNRQAQPFYRKVDYTLGVVELIHRTKHSAYARVTVGRGDELSLKVDKPTKLKRRPNPDHPKQIRKHLPLHHLWHPPRTS